MKHVYPWIFAIGALLLMIHLFQKLVTGVGSADAEDAIALLVLAGRVFFFDHFLSREAITQI